MDDSNYLSIARSMGARRSLGQNFMLSPDIARMEAAYAKGMNALELGPGLGILTRELCKTARSVLAVERDARLADMLAENVVAKNLRIVKGDFFALDESEFKDIEIMVSNIPYNLSSKVVYWLGMHSIPALICMQKEFAEHMLASPGTRNYSKLSVISSLRFRIHHVRDVHPGNFYPRPKVDSCIVYILPKRVTLDETQIATISALMSHKKKTLRNALMDSQKSLGIGKEAARKISESLPPIRPLHMQPGQLLEVADLINAEIYQKE